MIVRADTFPVPVIVIGLLLLAALSLYVAYRLDVDRIAAHLRHSCCRLVEYGWSPFGPGWFGEHARIYRIVYDDRDGDRHSACFKISLFGGVYRTNDRVLGRERRRRRADRSGRPVELEAENARLRARIAELERGSD